MKVTVKKIIELQACPFCGNEELAVTPEDSYNELQAEHGSVALSVRCWNCNAEKYAYFTDEAYDIALGIAVDGWNRRTNL